MKEHLTKWEKETQSLTNLFVRHYFGKDADSYWVADEIGGVLYVNDYFFSMHDMVEFIRCRYSKEKMFEYYEYRLQHSNDDAPPINIKYYNIF